MMIGVERVQERTSIASKKNIFVGKHLYIRRLIYEKCA
jgi:hypothetical protein